MLPYSYFTCLTGTQELPDDSWKIYELYCLSPKILEYLEIKKIEKTFISGNYGPILHVIFLQKRENNNNFKTNLPQWSFFFNW